MEVAPLVSDTFRATPARPRIAVLVGGEIGTQHRAAVQASQAPRIDVLELESQHSAALLDFIWLRKHQPSRVYSLLARWLGWSAALSIYVFLHARAYEVIYATGEDIGIPLAVLSRLFRRKFPHIIMRLEQPSYGRTPLRRRMYTLLFQYGVHRVDLTLCRTQAHADYLNNTLRIPDQQIQVVHEPVDMNFFTPEAPATTSAKLEELRQPYIFSAGLEMRDYETLIEAVRGLDIALVIAAGSPWSHFSFSSEQVDLPSNVSVSSFSRVEMRELYRCAKMVVVAVKPTNRACGMNVVLEAWAMKKPLVATKTIGLAEYIQDGVTGRLVEPQNIPAMRQAILELLENPRVSTHLAENGHQHAAAGLTLDHFISTVGNVLTHFTHPMLFQ